MSSGVDFLGMINFSDHRILRTTTKRRMCQKISKKYEQLREGLISLESFNQTYQSYLPLLKHCNGYGMVKKLEDRKFISNGE